MNRLKTREEHGMRDAPEYHTWSSMKSRCNNKRSKDYPRYGARGIKVCREWHNSFLAFYKDMGKRPTPEHSLDRIDMNGDYEPSNCRWATRYEQSINRRSNRYIEYGGKRLRITQWAKEVGLRRLTIKRRLDDLGWSVEDALTIPPKR